MVTIVLYIINIMIKTYMISFILLFFIILYDSFLKSSTLFLTSLLFLLVRAKKQTRVKKIFNIIFGKFILRILKSNIKIPQSGICQAPCVLRQCTVIFA